MTACVGSEGVMGVAGGRGVSSVDDEGEVTVVTVTPVVLSPSPSPSPSESSWDPVAEALLASELGFCGL